MVLTGALFAAVSIRRRRRRRGLPPGKEGGGRAFAALVAGLVFTIGMGVTDTIDGRLLWRIGRGAGRQRVAQKFRRMLGWLVVGISCAVAVYNIGVALAPEL